MDKLPEGLSSLNNPQEFELELINKELDRLHKILLSSFATEIDKEWAKAQTKFIHEQLFSARCWITE